MKNASESVLRLFDVPQEAAVILEQFAASDSAFYGLTSSSIVSNGFKMKSAAPSFTALIAAS